jgi:phage host-nuclease inhibitor protein Gam
MKKTRIRTTQPVIVSREEAELLVNEIALAENRRRTLSAEMDEKILAIRESYTPALDQCASDIKQKSALVQGWAESDPSQFEKTKHVKFYAGKVGFRTGTPKLALLSRKFTWESVLELVTNRLPNFIRPKWEIDKEAIINQREELAEFLPSVGLKVTQDESFYIEPDLAAIQQRLTQEAA